jgi:hypothetical protein
VTDPASPAEPDSPAESLAAADPGIPAETVASAESVAPADPGFPAESVAPAEPAPSQRSGSDGGLSRAVIVALVPPSWTPPGVDPAGWRHALAEDMVDLLATLAEVEPAVAVLPRDRALADAVVWPTMRVYELPELTVNAILAAAGAHGYEQAAVLAPDAPDLPAMLIGKLLRPLSSRPLAVAPDATGGLLGVAATLPLPGWLPEVDLAAQPALVRAAAPHPGQVAITPGWHRLSGPDGLSRLDPALEGWESTRALLSPA